MGLDLYHCRKPNMFYSFVEFDFTNMRSMVSEGLLNKKIIKASKFQRLFFKSVSKVIVYIILVIIYQLITMEKAQIIFIFNLDISW